MLFIFSKKKNMLKINELKKVRLNWSYRNEMIFAIRCNIYVRSHLNVKCWIRMTEVHVVNILLESKYAFSFKVWRVWQLPAFLFDIIACHFRPLEFYALVVSIKQERISERNFVQWWVPNTKSGYNYCNGGSGIAGVVQKTAISETFWF